jgi:hypothetical protein
MSSVIVLIYYDHRLLDPIIYLCLFSILVVSRINKHHCAHYNYGSTIVILKRLCL